MPYPKTIERLAELDALLSSDGVDINELAERWGLGRYRVFDLLKRLRFEKGPIASRLNDSGRRIYRYQTDEPLKSKAAQFAEERKQQRRIDTLERMQSLLGRLRKTDEAGVEWVLRELADNGDETSND